MKYLRLNKKGVSPIIATLLLIVIAVAAAVVTYAFVTGFIGTSSGSATQTGSMSFDSYDITSNTTVDVWVRNTGTKALTVASCYLDGAAGAVNGTLAFNPGQVTRVTCTFISTTLLDGLAHQLRVVCSDGTPLQISVVES